MILHAYSGYAKYAWGANEHRPIAKTSHGANVFGSQTLGVTIIDSLDTIFLADLQQFYLKSKLWIEKDFRVDLVRRSLLLSLSASVNCLCSKASEVSAFEINIRLVGGFLSIYALTNEKVKRDEREDRRAKIEHLVVSGQSSIGR